MAKVISQQEIERMLKGLSSPYSVRRREDAKALAQVTESCEEIVVALEGLAGADPDPAVREAAKYALNAPAHQQLYQQMIKRRQEEQVRKQEERARLASLHSSLQSEASETLNCPNCGYRNPREGKFCQGCGAALAVTCGRCGVSNPFMVAFCGNCGTELSEATFGIPVEEAARWRDAFSSLGWIEELGPRTRQLLAQLEPSLDASREPILFLTYGRAQNHIQDVLIDGVKIRRDYFGVIGTNWRIICVDTDKMKLHTFPYEDIASVAKPEGGGLLKEVRYTLFAKSGRSMGIVVRLDAPGWIGFIAGFGNPVTAGQIIGHKRRAGEVIGFLNQYFTRIVP